VPRLDHTRCKLLRDEPLVGRFNAVNDVLEEATRELPRFADREVVAEVRGELTQLAKTMSKQRFEIGFIGPSQAGKSTTVGNLLSVSEKDSPAPQGSGGATTSVPTRLVPRPTAEGTEHAVTLRYFSEEEFRSRVRDMCDVLNVRYETSLESLRDTVRKQHEASPHFRAADHEVFLKLLDAAIACPEVLQPAGLEEKGDYAQRRIYATHRDKDEPPNKYSLLREIRIDFATDAISPEIEMIDLPGLGVEKGSDDRLTLAFLHHLDGAFMFQHAIQVQSGAVSQLAEKMRETYSRTLGERIWMVVTRCDALNDLGLQGPSDEPNPRSMFCHLDEVLRHQGIKGHNVLFVGNAYYQDRLKEGLEESSATSDTLVSRYEKLLRFDENGQPLVPERCGQYPGQVDSWKRFVLDSGIPALRETMQTKVADSVREQTRREVASRLVGVIDKLTAALQAAEQQSGMTVEEMMRAARWSGELDRLAEEIGRGGQYSQDAATAISRTLGEVIDGWGRPTRGALAETHQNLSGMLSHAGLHEASAQTTAVIKLVKTELEKRSQSQTPPKAAGLPTPIEHWSTVSATYLDLGKTADGQPFRGPIFDAIREDPNPVTAGGQQLAADDYLAVMRSKAGRVARVFASRLVHEIQVHLHRLQQRYRAVGSEIDHIDADQRERYAKYRTELDRLRH
jgi:hypothetical protein